MEQNNEYGNKKLTQKQNYNLKQRNSKFLLSLSLALLLNLY